MEIESLDNTTHLLLALIRYDVCGEPLASGLREALTADALPALYRLSKSHDMAHIVAHALERMGLLGTDEISAKLRKQYMLAVYRQNQLGYELQRICEALERARIPFLPLKGSVLRPYYPEPWMRTSSDIDVFVWEKDFESAVKALVTACGYRMGERTPHDISLYAGNGVHLELHYSLLENERVAKVDTLLANISDHVCPASGSEYRLEMSDAMFYFYHVTHMAKHFASGGCGIRPLLDTWVLNRRAGHDPLARKELLESGGLLTFDTAQRRLCDVWFGDAEPDPLCLSMQAFILSGGVYGSIENHVAAQKDKKGGGFRYLLSRAFLPYDRLKLQYPVLVKHKWLTPVMQVRRWVSSILRGRGKRLAQEVRTVQATSRDTANATAQMLSQLEL